MNGIFNIDKPYGITSMDVIREIRHATNISKVGHGGTLDPLASGVIPVAIGNSTRLLEYILNNNKKYIAEITLGISTTTYDLEGTITKKSTTSNISKYDIEKTLKTFEGEISQTPPMYSAIKSNGKPLYKLAREGVSVKRQARPTTVYSVLLNSYTNPTIEVEITCSKGFYVRSFANEIGVLLECGAHLSNLRRTASGSFSITNSIPLSTATEKMTAGNIKDIILDPTDYLDNIEKIYLTEYESTLIKNGKNIEISSENISQNTEIACAYSSDKKFLAILTSNSDSQDWHPQKVFLDWSV